MNKPTLYVMVGNIGCGKSTWVKQQKDKLVISRDKIRYMLGNDNYLFDPKLESSIFNTEQYLLSQLMSKGINNILVDEVGIDKTMRKEYITLAKFHNYKIIAVEMPRYDKKECVDRRMYRESRGYDREIWEMVWDKFDKRYEAPSLEEGFDEILKIKEFVNAIY